jgi:hypothetical protein
MLLAAPDTSWARAAVTGTVNANPSYPPLSRCVCSPSCDIERLIQFLSLRVACVVIGRSGLSGLFDLDLEWTPDEARRARRGERDATCATPTRRRASGRRRGRCLERRGTVRRPAAPVRSAQELACARRPGPDQRRCASGSRVRGETRAHSRNMITGSIRDARRAGRNEANSAMASRAEGMVIRTTGSSALISYK